MNSFAEKKLLFYVKRVKGGRVLAEKKRAWRYKTLKEQRMQEYAPNFPLAGKKGALIAI